MKKTLLVGALVVALGALGTYLAFARAPRTKPGVRAAASAPPPRTEPGFRSGIFDPPRDAPAVNLDGSDGKKLRVSDHLGKVVILEFGYTHCQYVCPVTLGRLRDAYNQLGDAARDVQLIYVTVDPKRDSPERLREYLAAYNPTFLGATGSPDDLAAALKAYGVVAQQVASKDPKLEYAMDHSSFLYLVDRQGKIRGLVPYGTSAKDIAHDLETLLKTQI